MSEHVTAFGRFELFPNHRLLTESGTPIRLGSRALDILVALIARAGEVISKEDLSMINTLSGLVKKPDDELLAARIRPSQSKYDCKQMYPDA
jgi:DNA-binding response OmpR family regulator